MNDSERVYDADMEDVAGGAGRSDYDKKKKHADKTDPGSKPQPDLGSPEQKTKGRPSLGK